MPDQAEEGSDAETDGLRPYCADDSHAFPDQRLNSVIAKLESDPEVAAYLEAQNVNPVTRKGYNDHGAKHTEIVRDRALCLYELLKVAGVQFNGARDQGLEEADEPVIVALAAVLHDIGHVVHRTDHPYYSIPLAADLLDRLLPEWYDQERTVKMKGETLHAILCHHTEETPLTTEAGVVRVADALDMERGRSRIPYDEGSRGINTLSSQAIHRVRLTAGDEVPVHVEIEMTDAVGVYQVDELLKAKLRNSRLEDVVRVVALKVDGKGGDLLDRIEV